MINKEKIKNAVKEILEAIGENPNREGLRDTPKRVAEMYEEIFAGIGKDLKSELSTHFLEEDHKEMVLIKDIPFYSICEHHLIPFIGKAHVAYIPKGKIIGLSKLARVVDTASKKPQLQERLTSEIADAIAGSLNPCGVLVVIEAEHLCMSMRGIKKAGHTTTTSAIRGVFKEHNSTREEALALINKCK